MRYVSAFCLFVFETRRELLRNVGNESLKLQLIEVRD